MSQALLVSVSAEAADECTAAREALNDVRNAAKLELNRDDVFLDCIRWRVHEMFETRTGICVGKRVNLSARAQ